MRLAIQLLGAPQFQLDHSPVTAGRRAVVALLAYLTVSHMEHPGQKHPRESLAALLWTNYGQTKALSNLRHTLWEVTQFIGEGWILTEHEMVYLHPQADFLLDVAQFRSALERASHESNPAIRIPLLVEAARLYRSDFLEGFILKDDSNFNEWALSQAAGLRRDFASALEILVADYQATGQISAAISYAQRLIALDPIQEAAHRQLMRLYALTDQRTAAIQQYQTLEKLLRKELNLDPQSETRELYKKIRKGDLKPSPAASKTSQPETARLKHNLPFHLTTFIGRERERSEIERFLGGYRLVTLIGAGGIGKTRLAIQVGQALLDTFSDGVWFIPLEALTDEDLVPQTVASFLNISEHPDQPVLETLIHQLSSKRVLLILDNCEHLLEACAQLTEVLLKGCPHLKLLTTSREALRLPGEALYPVPAFAIPTTDGIQSIDELAQYESIKLFLERARLVQLGFELTEANFQTVVKICERLDGIPLAIELAAAHANIFTLNEILRQLNRSFDLLASDVRSVLPRHQTMRTCIEWGWRLLPEAERAFMRQLSVFIGGWTLQAVQAVGIQAGQALIGSLVKKSFVIVDQQTQQETRYGFHEVIRAYAHAKLVEAGEVKMMRDRHLEYFLELSRQFEPALRGVDQDLWLERLFTERDNIRAALVWAATTNVQAGLNLANRIRAFWEAYDLREEARWLLML